MSPSPASTLQGYARQFSRSQRRSRNANNPLGARNPTPVAQPTPPQATPPASEPTLDEAEADDDEDDDDDEVDIQDVVDAAEDEDGVDGVEIVEDIDGNVDGEIIEEVPMDVEPPFDATGLKEIGNLASWTVSTYKPGCGVEALRDDDTNLFWQSDGPQPHHLNIHFSRLVSILSIRIYLDFEADESYTPTRITLLAGTGYHDLIPFSSLEFTQPKGWIDVPLESVGGGPDGNTLRAFLIQVKVMENHQNGKDTHVRGLKIYARDEKSGRGVGVMGGLVREMGGKSKITGLPASRELVLTEPDWMTEPELR